MAEMTVDRAAARRFLVRRHLLAPPRSLPADPASVKVVIERLGSLQFDPLDVTGRNHDLVLAARIEGYARAWTDDLLYRERWLYEAYNKGLSLLPTAELPYYRIGWDRYQASNGYGKMDDHAELVEELLDKIRQDGTLSSTDVEPRASIDWYWRPTNQVRAILEALSLSGVLAISRRDGNRRLYDLSERLFPAELLAERRTEDEQRRHKLLSRYRAHGLLGMRGGNQEVWIGTAPTAAERYRFRDELIAEGLLLPVTVEGVKGDRLILAEEAPTAGGGRRARRARRRIPRAARPARLGPRAPAQPVGLRLRLGGLRPGGEAALGLLRAAAALGRAVRRADRAADRAQDGHAPCPRPLVGGRLRPARRARLRRRARGSPARARGVPRRDEDRPAADRAASRTGRGAARPASVAH